MTKRKAVRLEPGTEVIYGECFKRKGWLPLYGIVRRVTERGGVLLSPITWAKGERLFNQPDQWVPYSWVYGVAP